MKNDAKKQRIKSIDVENLNIVDTEGNIKMTLFGRGNVPAAIMNEKDILPGHRQDDPISGIMFYNGEGDECGGLIFGSEKKDNGEYNSALSLTFDQYKQDQIVQVVVDDNNGEQAYGFYIFDRPDIPLPEIIEQSMSGQNIDNGHQRIFMGKNRNGDVSVRLSDSNGKERIRMVIDSNDIPRMEFLDEKGSVIYSLPPKE